MQPFWPPKVFRYQVQESFRFTSSRHSSLSPPPGLSVIVRVSVKVPQQIYRVPIQYPFQDPIQRLQEGYFKLLCSSVSFLWTVLDQDPWVKAWPPDAGSEVPSQVWLHKGFPYSRRGAAARFMWGWPLPWNQFSLGRPYRELLITTTQLPGSQTHKPLHHDKVLILGGELFDS